MQVQAETSGSLWKVSKNEVLRETYGATGKTTMVDGDQVNECLVFVCFGVAGVCLWNAQNRGKGTKSTG